MQNTTPCSLRTPRPSEAGCRLCPRECGAWRNDGQIGRCGADGSIRIGLAGLHLWEEPVLCTGAGSGAVFFSHCPLGCIFCQNHVISHDGSGRHVTLDELVDILLDLEQKGASNLNLVTGTQYASEIVQAVRLARRAGLTLPVVWNSSAYETVETLEMLQDTIDVYLPDFKFWNEETACAFAQAPDYRVRCKLAVREMVRQAGECCFAEDGSIVRGVIVRHLLLPGRVGEAKKILSFLWHAYGDSIYVSLMRQYTPVFTFPEHPELERRVSDEEYEEAADHAVRMGMRNLFLQRPDSAEPSFIPDFEQG